jgi:hypothetical protein
MADSKITALTSIGTITDPAVDPLVIVDVSDTSMAATGTTKKVTLNNLLACSPTATLASATITGDLTVRTNKLAVTSTGVGIGTASPTAALDILGAFGTSTAAAVIRNNSAANNSNISQVQFFTVNSFGGIEQVASIHGTNPNASANNGGALVFNTSLNGTATTPAERYRIGNDGTATWSVAGTTAMTLNSTGLGVGAASPYSKLHIQGPTQAGCSLTMFYTGIQTATIGIKSNGSLTLGLDGSNGTTDRLLIDTSGNVGVGVTPSAWGSAFKPVQLTYGSLYSQAFTVAGVAANCYNAGAGGWTYFGSGQTASRYEQSVGTHAWYTAVAGTGAIGTFTQAMTLDASRNLSVNTTAYIGVGTGVVNSSGGFNIVPDNTGSASNRNWSIFANGSAAGNLDFAVSSANNTYPNSAYRMQLTSAGALNNTTGTYGTISDLRLKENISDARNYLADLLKLRVVKYSLKEESSAVATKLGFIAQEVEQVFPNLVDQSDKEYDGAEGIRSVKTSILIPMLLKAIQELTARVQTIEAR